MTMPTLVWAISRERVSVGPVTVQAAKRALLAAMRVVGGVGGVGAAGGAAAGTAPPVSAWEEDS